MTRVRGLGLVIAALVLLLDQASKYFVTVPVQLPARGTIELLPILRLIWVGNQGVSFGLLTADGNLGRWLLVALTAVIALGVLVWLWRERHRVEGAALGLILGGALGNIVDRSRLGYVADFMNLHFGGFSPFMVFNVADAAISFGVIILLARSLLGGTKKDTA